MASSRLRSTPLPLSSRTYPYRALGGPPLKPAVPIVLHGPRMKMPLQAIVDSGADFTFVPEAHAPHLGIDLGHCQQEVCETAGGLATMHLWTPGLDALIQGINVVVHLDIAFAQTPQVLLGREDFFNAFRVAIDHRSQTFTLESY